MKKIIIAALVLACTATMAWSTYSSKIQAPAPVYVEFYVFCDAFGGQGLALWCIPGGVEQCTPLDCGEVEGF